MQTPNTNFINSKTSTGLLSNPEYTKYTLCAAVMGGILGRPDLVRYREICCRDWGDRSTTTISLQQLLQYFGLQQPSVYNKKGCNTQQNTTQQLHFYRISQSFHFLSSHYDCLVSLIYAWRTEWVVHKNVRMFILSSTLEENVFQLN